MRALEGKARLAFFLSDDFGSGNDVRDKWRSDGSGSETHLLRYQPADLHSEVPSLSWFSL